MIESRDLTFEYSRYNDDGEKTTVTALKDLNFQIESGSFVSILGHNGSGKSTLAKHLNALFVPTDGVLWVNGYDTNDEAFIWDIRKSVGMVFQNPDNQIIASIVEEDVAFGPENIGIPPKEIRKRVNAALKAVGMETYARHSAHMLSGGQKQRIAIAGILAIKPGCIVLDEPTAMLDPLGRKEVMDTILRLNRDEGITIILITHFVEEAAQSDRVIIMDDGEIAMDGPPRVVLNRSEEIQALGLEAPHATRIAELLYQEYHIKLDPDDILNSDELVGALCQYKLKI